MSLVVETAKPQDADAIGRVLERSYSVLLGPDYSADQLQVALPIISVAKPDLIASGRYFVVRLSGALVGVGGWSEGDPRQGGKAGKAHIRHVATDPSATRMGVGSAIMGQVFKSASAAGVGRLHCLSTLTAVPFYQAQGFGSPKQTTVFLAGRSPFPCVLLDRKI